MSNALTLLARFTRFSCLLTLGLVLSQCTPARYTSLPPPLPPPASQQIRVTPPPPPPAPPVSAEKLLNRLNASLDRA